MTDPKDELGKRFEDRRPDDDPTDGTDPAGGDPDQPDTAVADEVDNSSDTGDSSYTNNSNNASNSSDTDNTDNMADSDGSSSTPGPTPDPDATRNRQQVPMYLPDETATRLDALYDRLDGRSKVAGDGGIEKHADFMQALVEFALDHEEDLAARLEIPSE